MIKHAMKDFVFTVLPVWVIALALMAFANDTKPKTQLIEPQVVDMTERTEWLFDSRCVESITPTMQLKVHVPLDDHGRPISSKAYADGPAIYKMKDKCDPQVHFYREAPHAQ
jgi:hypothetical protein